MASPIEHFLVILSDAIEKKHEDMDLAHYARKVAQECEHAGFPSKNGFTGEDPNNKRIAKITIELNKKYKLFPFEKD
tara:strand:+ start:252 stop:482 length:231 start_codon:yes stop_codon:yes gene_type:complete